MNINDLKIRLSEVLTELLNTKFKSKLQLARALDSNATSITQYIEGKRTYPQADFIFNLCTKIGISPTWLILGVGEKYLSEKINTVNGNGNTVGYIGNNNSNITQVMHSNDILVQENESLKREITLLREMVDMLKK